MCRGWKNGHFIFSAHVYIMPPSRNKKVRRRRPRSRSRSRSHNRRRYRAASQQPEIHTEKRPEKHRWSDGERAKLMELCSGTDMSWEDIAARISDEFGTNRTGDACRIEFNRMGVGGRQTSGKRNVDKETWTVEEDKKLQKLYKDYGPQWRKISKHFHDRTDSSIRNRWCRRSLMT